MTANGQEPPNREALNRVWSKIREIKVAWLTTVGRSGVVRTRPMMTRFLDQSHDLWFFTSAIGGKADDIRNHDQVAVAYVDPDQSAFYSLSGRGQVVRDARLIEQLWTPLLLAWLPDGPASPDLALLRVTVEAVENWDARSIASIALIASKQFAADRRSEGIDPIPASAT